MKSIFLFILILVCQRNLAQVACKTRTLEEGSKEKTCFHLNKKPSIVELWDSDRRFGSIKAFNNSGVELFTYYLRTVGGHSSVYLDYYPNGQIKKAEYSSAPDGGIQFWRIIHHFDDQGKQTSYSDFSQPDGRPHLFIPELLKEKTEIKKIEKQAEVVKCATPYLSIIKIGNRSNKKLLILLKAKKNPFIQVKDTLISLKPNKDVIIKSQLMAEKFLPADALFEPIIIDKRKSKSNIKIISSITEGTNFSRTYFWYAINEE